MKRTLSRGRFARTTRLLAVAAGLAAVTAMALPSAQAAPAQTYDASQLATVNNAVSQSAGRRP